jgi:integrase|tara:strand:- start:110 stop:1387 length:1278 start_codon:yes stop_codon:yes gene_type:complete
MPQYLQKRRRKWYAVLAIPKAIQVNFGKAKFIKSLETDSLSVAERKVQPIILEWKREIELAKGNETTGSELLESVRFVRRDAQRMRAEGETDEDIKYVHEDIAYSRSWNPDINDFQTNNEELAVAVSVVHGSEFLLSEHIDEYLNSKTTAEKTKDQVRRDLIDYTERFELAQNVTRLKMVEWANVVLGSERGLEIVTCRRIVSSCRGYWKWLVLNKNLELPPPFDDVLPPKSKKKSKADIAKKRKAFRVRDYQKLLEACPAHDTLLCALIKLGAYTGCRIEELCILKVENIAKDRFEVIDAKSEAGWRTVPIHPHIADLVNTLKSSTNAEYLLPDLTLNKYGERANAIGKRFGRLKTKLGYGEDYVFHSFRKGFATQLENAGMQHNISARLMGHELGDQTFGGYSDGVMLERLVEAISHINWKNT